MAVLMFRTKSGLPVLVINKALLVVLGRTSKYFLRAVSAALFIGTVLSALFSSSETSMMALNRYRLKHQAKSGHKGAIKAQKLLETPDRLLGVILLGNNFVNIFASSIATIIAMKLIGEAGIALAAGLLTLVILVFAEVAPKTLAALYPEKIAYPAAFVLTPLLKIFSPIVWLVNFFANGFLFFLILRTLNFIFILK